MFMMKPEQFIGQQLGSYRLTEFLKGGGFGFVYKAEHVNLQKNVAVKLLRPEHVLKEEYVAAFEREAKIIASFTHPHILDVHHYEVFHGIPFLAMPFIEQGSLRTLHPRHSIVETSTIISYVKQIAAALQYAHDHKFVHRDVKPDNFLRGPQGVLLSDFGITITAHRIDSLSLQDRVGTLAYMSPEQFDGKAQVWSDQYSLAVVVYEWFCGKLPFFGESIFEIERKHKQEDPPILKQQGVDVPPSIESVVRKGLAKKPEERYGTVTEFANALEKAALALVSRVDLSKGSALQSEAVPKEEQFLKQQVITLDPSKMSKARWIGTGGGWSGWSVIWSPDGTHIVSASSEGRVSKQEYPHDLKGGQSMNFLHPGASRYAKGWSKASKRANSYKDNRSKMFDELFEWFAKAERANIASTKYVTIVSGCEEGSTFQIWKLINSTAERNGITHMFIAWSSDCSKFLVSTRGEEMKSRVLDFVGKEIERFLGRYKMLAASIPEANTFKVDWDYPVAWSRLGNRFAFVPKEQGSIQHLLVYYGQEDKIYRIGLKNLGQYVDALSWSPSGQALVIAVRNGPVIIWSAQSKNILLWEKGEYSDHQSVVWSPDEVQVAICGSPGAIWQIRSSPGYKVEADMAG